MASEILSIGNYAFSNQDRLFLDTNIWMYVYGPQSPNDWRNKVYSGALANILRANAPVFVDVLVLSEFINRYARVEHSLAKERNKVDEPFKSYRMSDEFKPVAKVITDSVRRITRFCRRLESGFQDVDLEQLLTDFETQRPDFNDQILVSLCKSHDLTMVTHDADFRESGLSILTANSRLLQ
jgi:predicted nucleic acid-binding protein